MYSLALIIFVVSEKKAFEHFPIGSNVNLCPTMAAILDRGQTSERKYDADLMKAQFEECKMWNIDSISAQVFILTENGLTDTNLFTM